MWLVFSLLAPLFFAVVHVMDSYCVEDIFEKPWMGMVTSSVTSVIVLIPLPYILPFLEWSIPSWNIIVSAFIAGSLIQISQGLYFQAHSYSEAGIIAAYWNMIPFLIILISFIFLGHRLSIFEYIGVAVLISASTYILLADENFEFRSLSFFLMFFASLMQAIAYMLLDHVYEEISFAHAFIYMSFGLITAGISPLFFKKVRMQFQRSYEKLHTGRNLFIAIEVVNLIALALAEKAIELHEPALVAAVETTMPAFTFGISIGLLFTTAKKYGDTRSLHKIWHKMSAIGLMTIGVYLLT